MRLKDQVNSRHIANLQNTRPARVRKAAARRQMFQNARANLLGLHVSPRVNLRVAPTDIHSDCAPAVSMGHTMSPTMQPGFFARVFSWIGRALGTAPQYASH